MDDNSIDPLAHRILKQFSEHLLGGVLTPEEPDFRTMRVIFRSLGGSWESVYRGDIKQITLLEKIVTNWGTYKQKQKGSSA